MEKGIIIYQSKYGATKKYANWLRNMTNFHCIETSNAKVNEVSQYEIIILCGGIYASKIAGLNFLKKNIGNLKNKKLVILCVGASSYEESMLAEIKEHNLTGDLRDIPLFYARGASNESKMSFVDKTLCKMLQKSIAKKDPSTYEPWMEALMCAVWQNCDWTDKKYLISLVDYLKK